MKQTIIKLDRYILNRLTDYIRRWIKKHDYKKHKVDFEILVKKAKVWLAFILTVLIPTMILILQNRFFSAGLQFILWSICTGISYMALQRTIYKRKPEHDLLFAQRKNPVVYETEKVVLEMIFVAWRKSRIIMIFGFLFLFWLMAGNIMLFYYFAHSPHFISLSLFFLIASVLDFIDGYLFFVFDFDEPEEKKKVVKESLTEIVVREWQRLIGGLAPAPTA